MVPAGPFLQAVAARLYSACGWLSFRFGLRRQARRHYERVLRLKGDDFSAYVHLGRIAYDTGDYAGWRREFEHARRADPARFARLRHPFELFEPRLAGTTFEDTGERATWRSMRPFEAPQRIGGRRQPELGGDGGLDGLPAAFDVPGLDDFGADDPLADLHDDCYSSAERQRFDELGPIDPTEIALCDIDALADRLAE